MKLKDDEFQGAFDEIYLAAIEDILEVIREEVAGEADPKSKYADAIIDVFGLSPDFRFGIHARVFREDHIAMHLVEITKKSGMTLGDLLCANIRRSLRRGGTNNA